MAETIAGIRLLLILSPNFCDLFKEFFEDFITTTEKKDDDNNRVVHHASKYFQ